MTGPAIIVPQDLAKAIHPSIKPSYSPNLHKFVSKWQRQNKRFTVPEVWRTTKSDGLIASGALWIGRMDPEAKPCSRSGFIGARMIEVLCQGPKVAASWWTNTGPATMERVPDFWERYLEIGRCAIDTEHRQVFVGDDGRYALEGDVRTCTWCGAQHRRRVEIKTITKEIEHFDAITPEAP